MKFLPHVAGSTVAAAGLMFTSLSAFASGPTLLTDRQLDGVTAGGSFVLSSSDAQATGSFTLTNTTSNSIVVNEPSPYPGNPNLGPSAGATDATATSVGNNTFTPNGAPPATSATGVTTTGGADGNQVITSSYNATIHGAGGVTFQAGWTVVYGAWIGL
ncbi:MAG TPA: hypothetical protein VKZ79_01405 [Alphaproteobacteria bacterium]|nr:hypothetical protein [Alphaproteobacteria bacterium]